MPKPTFPNEQADEAKTWDLPFVEDRYKDDTKTNAINKTSTWRYEPPEPEEEILPPTAEEIEAIRKAAFEEGFAEGKTEGLEKGHAEGLESGHKEGFDKGKEQGFAEGFASGEAQINEHIQTWQSLLEQLTQPIQLVEKELEEELVKLAVSLARAVVRSEVTTNQDVIFQALSEGLKVLPIQEKQYRIHLHPEDIVLIKQHFSAEEIDKHNWLLLESTDLSRGGCDITTESNAVNVSIERRCREILDKFLLDNGLAED